LTPETGGFALNTQHLNHKGFAKWPRKNVYPLRFFANAHAREAQIYTNVPLPQSGCVVNRHDDARNLDNKGESTTKYNDVEESTKSKDAKMDRNGRAATS